MNVAASEGERTKGQVGNSSAVWTVYLQTELIVCARRAVVGQGGLETRNSRPRLSSPCPTAPPYCRQPRDRSGRCSSRSRYPRRCSVYSIPPRICPFFRYLTVFDV